MLKFLLSAANEDQVSEALTIPSDHRQNTPLHRAIRRADVPCVKAMLEAGADPSLTNANDERPVDFILAQSTSKPVKYYTKIVHLLLVGNHAEIFRSLQDPTDDSRRIGSTTPLIMAVKRTCLDIVSMLIDAALQQHNEDGKLAQFVNEEDSDGRSAFSYVCEAEQWPLDQKGRDKVIAIAKILILHGADVGKGLSIDKYIYYCNLDFPIRWNESCTYSQVLDILCFQRDMICLLLENCTSTNNRPIYEDSTFYIALWKFLRAARDYWVYFEQPGELHLEPERILDISGLLKRGRTNNAPEKESNSNDVSEEDDSTPICQTLLEMLDNISKHLEDVDKWWLGHGLAALRLAATIPGIFGLRATQKLLERGASPSEIGEFGCSAMDYAKQRNVNKAAISLMDRWAGLNTGKDRKRKREGEE